ncbi:MAG: phenylalanine--tRNA ligase subunit beta [Propionibacteriales bacterium]|nr:phenylalanine--tRNA ligase subunit beta [Propionibacteriales bacterium]
MRVPLSWLREYVDLPADVTPAALADRLTTLGLKFEALHAAGADVTGSLVVGRVLSFESEKHSNGKTIRWCQVDVGEGEPRGIVCGAHNFAVDNLVVVALPGATLAGGFEIAARTTYGHVSDGMICSARELDLGDEHAGIIVLGSADSVDMKPGDDAAELLHLRDDVIEFEINPDRAYALSVRGVARDAAIAYGVEFRDPADQVVPTPDDAGYPVRLDDTDGCPAFAARTVSGFDPTAPTPRWLARRVQLAGMRPISLAVDVTNYVMLELGQPIHGYDRNAVSGPIVVRRATAGEKLTTLDGVSRSLDPEDLLITDDSGPIGLAGVMGGETTEMSESTSDVLIEAAHFSAVTVYRTERRHQLPSEASRRFERGVDPTLPARAAQRVADLLVAHGGGRIDDGVTLVGSAPAPVAVAMTTDLPTRVTGIEIDEATSVGALEQVGCTVEVAGGRITAVPPPWRPDLTDPNDLVEEVARIVGYDAVPSRSPVAPAGHGLTEVQRVRRRIGRQLAGSGYVEVLSQPFVGSSDWERLGLADDDARRRTIRIANPLSEEEPELRTTLLPGLLRALARNVARGQVDLSLFETGLVFLPKGDGAVAPIPSVDRRPSDDELAAIEAALPDQPEHLAVALCGDRERAGWWGGGRAAGWFDAVAAIRAVAETLGVPLTVRSGAADPWHPGRCAELVLGDEVVGRAGELHPRVCTAYGLPARTAVAEVDLAALLARADTMVVGPRVSSYPVAKEDVALIIDASVPAAEVEAVLRSGAGELCESVRLFDVYTGEQIGEGRKSLAFALRFRAPDRTLTEADTSVARDAAVAAAVQRFGAVPRV